MPYTTHPSLDAVPTSHLSEGIFSRMRELACTTELQSHGGRLAAGSATCALQVWASARQRAMPWPFMLGVGRGVHILTSCKFNCFRTPPTGRPRPENGPKRQNEEEGGWEWGGNSSASLVQVQYPSLLCTAALHFIQVIFFGLFRYLLSFLGEGERVKRKYTEINYVNWNVVHPKTLFIVYEVKYFVTQNHSFEIHFRVFNFYPFHFLASRNFLPTLTMGKAVCYSLGAFE
jgi:hypothetical protein